MRYIKKKGDPYVYPYTEALAARPDFEECTKTGKQLKKKAAQVAAKTTQEAKVEAEVVKKEEEPEEKEEPTDLKEPEEPVPEYKRKQRKTNADKLKRMRFLARVKKMNVPAIKKWMGENPTLVDKEVLAAIEQRCGELDAND